MCFYAAIPQGRRGWQYPISVSVSAVGDGLVEGVDFNFTDTVIIVPARVLDNPVPYSSDGPDPGPPFCFNLTLHDNDDVSVGDTGFVAFTIDTGLDVDVPTRRIEVEVFDDEVRHCVCVCVCVQCRCVIL